MASEENVKPAKVSEHLRTLHEREQERRLIVILEKASLEAVKVLRYFHIPYHDSQSECKLLCPLLSSASRVDHHGCGMDQCRSLSSPG